MFTGCSDERGCPNGRREQIKEFKEDFGQEITLKNRFNSNITANMTHREYKWYFMLPERVKLLEVQYINARLEERKKRSEYPYTAVQFAESIETGHILSSLTKYTKTS